MLSGLLGFVCLALGVLLVAPPLLTARNEALRREIDVLIASAQSTLADVRLHVSLEAAAIRGFIAVGDSVLLEPFFAARQNAEERLAHLDTLTTRLGPEAAEAQTRLEQAHAAWLAANLEIATRRLAREAFIAQAIPQQGVLFRAVFGAAGDVDAVLERERRTRHAQIRRAERVRNGATLALGVLALGAAAVTLGLGRRLRRYANALEAREAALRDLNATLEERVAARTAEVRRLTFEVAEAEFREQRRVALVLHDHLQQLLVAARLRLHAGPRGGPPDVERLDGLLGEAIDVTRSLSVELAPPVLRQGGVAEALRWLGAHFEEAYSLVVDVVIEPAAEAEASTEDQPGDVAVLLFQIARELLFNVVKHGKTDWAGLSLATNADAFVLTVEDEGAGFVPEAVGKRRNGLGLGSVRERIDLVGGTFEVASQPGAGTRVTVCIPRAGYASEPVGEPQESRG